MKLESMRGEKKWKNPQYMKIKWHFLEKTMSQREIKREIKKYLEENKNVHTTYQNCVVQQK